MGCQRGQRGRRIPQHVRHPLTDLGTAVLSLGHPVKATKRQSESYSYGAAGWLNDVDGVGYRMRAAVSKPIGRGKKGSSALYSVKDRYGEVERWGEPQEGEGTPWHYMGQFVVDNTPMADLASKAQTVCHVTIPGKTVEGGGRDRYDDLGEEILIHLKATTGKFKTVNALNDALRAEGVRFSKSDLAPALHRLANQGRIEWPEATGNGNPPRPGWLATEDELRRYNSAGQSEP